MGELDIRSNIEDKIKVAQQKIVQQPECWTAGVGTNVGWETKMVPFSNSAPTMDFYVHFATPIKGLYFPGNPALTSTPQSLFFSFNQIGVDLDTGAVNQSYSLFALNAGILLLFEDYIQDIYVTFPSEIALPNSGQVALMGMRGFRGQFPNG